MAQSTGNLQDLFLNQVRKEKISVTIYLTNGYQYKGLIKSFDNFVTDDHSNNIPNGISSIICWNMNCFQRRTTVEDTIFI